MKRILLIIAIISTMANARNLSYSGFFDQNFYHNINQLNRYLAHKTGTQSRQYFDPKNNTYILQVKLNGLDEDSINTTHKNGFLIIESNTKTEQKNDTYSRYSSSHFYQSFSLPKDADTKNIVSKFENDILNITIPKLKK